MPDKNKSRPIEKKLYLGPFHTYLEEKLYSEIKEIRKKDPLAPIIILVGSNLLGLYLKRLLAQRLGYHLNVRFLTVIDFARALTSESMAAEGRKEIPSQAGKLVVENYLKNKKDFGYFSEIASYRGLRDALLNTIVDLKEAGISAENFDGILQGPEKGQLPFLSKLQDLSMIYRHYTKVLEEKNLADRSDLILRASRLLKKDGALLAEAFDYPSPTRFKFLLYGFYDFNFIQRDLLGECIRISDAIVFSPYKESPSYQFARETYRWLQRLNMKVAQAKKHPQKKESLLERLKENLFIDTAKPMPPLDKDETFEIISTSGETREVKEILRITTALISQGFMFNDIGLFLRNTDTYETLLWESLEGNGVKCYSPSSLALSRTREGRSLLHFLSLLNSDYNRSFVMEFFHLADLDFPRIFKGIPCFSTADWDLLSKKAGIVSGKEEWIKRLKDYIQAMKEYEVFDESGEVIRMDPERIEEAEDFLGFMQSFFLDIESIPLEGKWSELSDKIWKSFSCWVRETDNLNLVQQVLQEMISLEQISEKTTMKQFYEFFKERLKRATRENGKFQSGSVTIASLSACRGINFKVIIAPGLAEKGFPIVIRQDPILLDMERRTINKAFPEERLPLKMDRIEEERLLFDLLVSSAGEKLIITFPRMNPDNAAERVPSYYLLQASEAITGDKVHYDEQMGLPFFKREALTRLFPAQDRYMADEQDYDLSVISKALHSKSKQRAYFLQEISTFFQKALMAESSRWGKRTFTPHDGIFSDPMALQQIRKHYSVFENAVSATSLEMYASCPFRYFCEKILKLKIVEEPEKIASLSPLDRGWLVHAILFDLFESLKKEDALPLRKEKQKHYYAQLERLAKRRFGQMGATGRAGFSMMWNIEKEAILQDLKEMIRVEAENMDDLVPFDFEIRFGMPKSDELEGTSSYDSPIPLTINGKKKVFFKGRIDRIDLSGDRSKGIVIDYKTGAVRHKHNSFMGGRSLQLPIYIFAAEHLLIQQLGREVILGSAEYFYVTRKGDFLRRRFDKNGWEEKLDHLKKIILVISEGIETGLFFQGVDEKTCYFCDYNLICGTAIDQRFQRKRNDPVIKDYLEILKIS